MHLSVWERPGDLTGRDISGIIQDPPHKRKKMPGVHGNEDEDQLNSKRNRLEKPGSLLPEPEEIQNLPLDLRKTHFTEMMLERGVSAFSSWDKELHKMVFDPRYLLLTSDQRKKVFAQFVKSRMKDEFREKKNKELKAREEFRQLLEEAKITSRSTFKEFCTRYRGDQRFSSLNRKKEQEVLFVHYITSLKKSDKENRSRLRKMR
ncbi:transcription elongation regulator 1-like protein [Cynoglossus semilaevis]|nr:transcription elongation regulator 1-like protein [Cynoglossus semilaevis]